MFLAAGSPGPGEKPDCPCAWVTQISPRGDTLGVTARSQPTALASPKCFAQGRDVPALVSLSWGGLPLPPAPSPCHTQHGSPTCCHIPAQCLEDRPTPPPVPALRHQPASVPSPSTLSKGMCHPVPHPKKRGCCARTVQRRSFGLGVLALEMSLNPRNSHHGQGDVCIWTSRLRASNSPPRSPRSPQASCEASAGKSLSG